MRRVQEVIEANRIYNMNFPTQIAEITKRDAYFGKKLKEGHIKYEPNGWKDWQLKPIEENTFEKYTDGSELD